VDLPLSHECKRVLAYAAEEAERLSHKHIGTEHLLLGLLREEKCFASEILHERGLRLARCAKTSAGQQRKDDSARPKEATLLSEFQPDLTQSPWTACSIRSSAGITSWSAWFRSCAAAPRTTPCSSGEPGVGKTAIVEGLAQRIAEGDVPSFLSDKRILALDLSLIVAGTKYRGQFEERLKTIMKELMENQNAIIFIDELHTLVGRGSAEGSLDAANILKPALSRGEVQCIGATTPGEFRKSNEKDRSLERRFQAVKVTPPNEADAVRILFGIKERYEKFHAVAYTDEAIETAVYTSSRFISDRFLPDKAIDLIDEAGARVKLRQTTLPTEVADVQKRIKFIVHRMRTPSPPRIREGEVLLRRRAQGARKPRLLRDKYNLDDTSTGMVTKDDIEDVVARWTVCP
jgi:ATP-dependent Clp protease ATP-binding subunit ClpC